MEIQLSYDASNKIVICTGKGEFDYEQSKKLIVEVYEFCNANNCSKLLIDFYDVSQADISVLQRYILGEEMALQWGPMLKAFVYAQEIYITNLAETVANNRGAQLMVTHELDVGSAWLNKTSL